MLIAVHPLSALFILNICAAAATAAVVVIVVVISIPSIPLRAPLVSEVSSSLRQPLGAKPESQTGGWVAWLQ